MLPATNCWKALIAIRRSSGRNVPIDQDGGLSGFLSFVRLLIMRGPSQHALLNCSTVNGVVQRTSLVRKAFTFVCFCAGPKRTIPGVGRGTGLPCYVCPRGHSAVLDRNSLYLSQSFKLSLKLPAYFYNLASFIVYVVRSMLPGWAG